MTVFPSAIGNLTSVNSTDTLKKWVPTDNQLMPKGAVVKRPLIVGRFCLAYKNSFPLLIYGQRCY